MNELPFRITTLLTSLVATGEGLALLVGVRMLGARDDPWLSAKNDLFLALDILAGAGLVYLALTRRATPSASVLVLTGLLLVAHGYREWEALAGTGNPFCFNTPLLAVNTLKLVGLLVAATLGVQLALAGRA